jgi:hypothetical protein
LVSCRAKSRKVRVLKLQERLRKVRYSTFMAGTRKASKAPE